MATKKRKRDVDHLSITQQMKREFWKYKLNPITGFPDTKLRANSVSNVPNPDFSTPMNGPCYHNLQC